MTQGGCLCEYIRYEYDGDPVVTALCHCNDCRKISGSAFSTNMLVPNDKFRVTNGKPTQFDKRADSGKMLTSFFCGKCGTTCFRTSESFPGLTIVKCGTLDVLDVTPARESYTDRRVGWIHPAEGCQQHLSPSKT